MAKDTSKGFTVELKKDGKKVAVMGPYAKHRSASVDAKSMLIMAGVATSSIVEKGKMIVKKVCAGTTEGKDGKLRPVTHKVQYVKLPSGYVGQKGGVTFEAAIKKGGALPTAQFSNPRRANSRGSASRRRNGAWRKTGAGGWTCKTPKGTLGVTFSYAGKGYFGSTPSEDGPIFPTLGEAKAWAERRVGLR